MRRAPICFAVVAVAFFIVSSRPVIAADADTDTTNLQLEVDALSSLNDLALSHDQLVAVKALIADTAGTMSDAPSPITADYKSALQNARTALLGKDQTKIDAAEDKLGDLQDKQDPDSDPDIDQSAAAKQKAPALLKMLSVKQVANYISQNSDDVDDPAALLVDAVHKARDATGDDFDSLRDDTAEEIGVLSNGTHPERPTGMVVKVKRLLTQVHQLSADDYKTQQPALEQEAKKLVANLDAIPCLRHWMENELADLLSNPQLGQAINDLGVK